MNEEMLVVAFLMVVCPGLAFAGLKIQEHNIAKRQKAYRYPLVGDIVRVRRNRIKAVRPYFQTDFRGPELLQRDTLLRVAGAGPDNLSFFYETSPGTLAKFPCDDVQEVIRRHSLPTGYIEAGDTVIILDKDHSCRLPKPDGSGFLKNGDRFVVTKINYSGWIVYQAGAEKYRIEPHRVALVEKHKPALKQVIADHDKKLDDAAAAQAKAEIQSLRDLAVKNGADWSDGRTHIENAKAAIVHLSNVVESKQRKTSIENAIAAIELLSNVLQKTRVENARLTETNARLTKDAVEAGHQTSIAALDAATAKIEKLIANLKGPEEEIKLPDVGTLFRVRGWMGIYEVMRWSPDEIVFQDITDKNQKSIARTSPFAEQIVILPATGIRAGDLVCASSDLDIPRPAGFPGQVQKGDEFIVKRLTPLDDTILAVMMDDAAIPVEKLTKLLASQYVIILSSIRSNQRYRIGSTICTTNGGSYRDLHPETKKLCYVVEVIGDEGNSKVVSANSLSLYSEPVIPETIEAGDLVRVKVQHVAAIRPMGDEKLVPGNEIIVLRVDHGGKYVFYSRENGIGVIPLANVKLIKKMAPFSPGEIVRIHGDEAEVMGVVNCYNGHFVKIKRVGYSIYSPDCITDRSIGQGDLIEVTADCNFGSYLYKKGDRLLVESKSQVGPVWWYRCFSGRRIPHANVRLVSRPNVKIDDTIEGEKVAGISHQTVTIDANGVRLQQLRPVIHFENGDFRQLRVNDTKPDMIA